jgi:hypothetical protein
MKNIHVNVIGSRFYKQEYHECGKHPGKCTQYRNKLHLLNALEEPDGEQHLAEDYTKTQVIKLLLPFKPGKKTHQEK